MASESIDLYNYDNHPFQTSNITVDDYLKRFNLLSSMDQHRKVIQSCIARRTKGGYIVNDKNLANGAPIFRSVTLKDLSERLCQSKTFTTETRTENTAVCPVYGYYFDQILYSPPDTTFQLGIQTLIEIRHGLTFAFCQRNSQ